MTERINQEKQVRESQGRYEQLFNANNDSISLVYLLPNGELSNFIEVNDAAGEIVGYTREELLNMSIRDLEELPLSKRLNGGLQRLSKRVPAGSKPGCKPRMVHGSLLTSKRN
ncbi:MAG: PAS domain S-box protein [Candidatus Cloacimonetes bacterium]|nr:PAS domain S-box protein [Candidatus Cloacimonadota bacterium]